MSYYNSFKSFKLSYLIKTKELIWPKISLSNRAKEIKKNTSIWDLKNILSESFYNFQMDLFNKIKDTYLRRKNLLSDFF